MTIAEPRSEQLQRQLLALRQAARRRDHFAHLPTFRTAFVRGILQFRKELRSLRRDRDA
ncbi:MAG: hypothetical protein LT103_12510 [Burkholderiaceae bacterium]|nr:hypothetical protein [Burkholderiaceae bacterium]